jgi:hypothetical protein
MPGPEHYLEAERILDALYGKDRGTVPGGASYAAETQVHATLALAAAVARQAYDRTTSNDLAWARATGEYQ